MISNHDISGPLILVTGANGFVGQALCAALERRGQRVRRALRVARPPAGAADSVTVGDLDAATAWDAALRGVDTVIHLAARTHDIHETGEDALAAYRKTNVEGTRRLAEAASGAGVRRFVFMSSVKVNGERTTGRPFSEADTPRPEDAYGLTKWEAEQTLRQIAEQTGMEYVVLRAPLVYGPGVKGNFLRLMQWVAQQRPLPLASVDNRRSLIYLDNLVDAIIMCAQGPAAAGGTYLVGDAESPSTPALVRALTAALGVRDRLLPCPQAALKLGAMLVGRSAEFARLTGSLVLDSTKIGRELGWKPRFSLAEGLAITAQWYHAQVRPRSPTE